MHLLLVLYLANLWHCSYADGIKCLNTSDWDGDDRYNYMPGTQFGWFAQMWGGYSGFSGLLSFGWYKSQTDRRSYPDKRSVGQVVVLNSEQAVANYIVATPTSCPLGFVLDFFHLPQAFNSHFMYYIAAEQEPPNQIYSVIEADLLTGNCKHVCSGNYSLYFDLHDQDLDTNLGYWKDSLYFVKRGVLYSIPLSGPDSGNLLDVTSCTPYLRVTAAVDPLGTYYYTTDADDTTTELTAISLLPGNKMRKIQLDYKFFWFVEYKGMLYGLCSRNQDPITACILDPSTGQFVKHVTVPWRASCCGPTVTGTAVDAAGTFYVSNRYNIPPVDAVGVGYDPIAFPIEMYIISFN